MRKPFDNVAAPALEHRTDRDALLADWGIHHLHLSSRLSKRQVRRGDDVLLAIFTDYDAYLIDIRGHPKFANWATGEVFAVVARNWPAEELAHQLHGDRPLAAVLG